MPARKCHPHRWSQQHDSGNHWATRRISVPVIKEGEFDKLFVVTIQGDKAKLKTRSYGKSTPQSGAR